VFSRGEEVVGIAQLHERGLPATRSIAPLGWGALTEDLELLFPEQDRLALLGATVSWIRDRRWLLVRLPQLRGHEISALQLDPRLADVREVVFETLELPPTWEALLARLTRSMRGNTRYYPRLLERHGHTLGFETVDAPEDLTAALAQVSELHRDRAQVRTRIPHKNYLKARSRRQLLRDVGALDGLDWRLRVGRLRVDGEVVAAQMWLEQGGTIHLLYSGYKPVWGAYSVAMITTSEIIQSGIRRGFKRVEFLRGEEVFKSRWQTSKRMRLDVILTPMPAQVGRIIRRFRRLRRVARRLRSSVVDVVRTGGVRARIRGASGPIE
jgi:CelD/BcsL family acetyltransferase involved in cellulose biosynthesis